MVNKVESHTPADNGAVITNGGDGTLNINSPTSGTLTLAANLGVVSLVGLNPIVPSTFTLQPAPPDLAAGLGIVTLA